MRTVGTLTPTYLDSGWIPLETATMGNATFYCHVTGTVSWNVYLTADDIFDPAITPTAIGFSGWTSKVSSGGTALPCKCSAVKFTSTVAASSSVVYTLLWS